ncbi:thermostable hemolysin [Pseudoalteromonas sp. MMG022]|uniref:thermostable hemolysin n=1 Tax=Pseudoalteromonas sp. MMG022 TaxID=2909978 RepID=UPI001F3FB514|nr:thermostable hemolysin [Pseudoalteromonas sp. MMG022]MCF6436885.1 thermostable hemolysin [Pseudoalteromonas sp. MMG022]
MSAIPLHNQTISASALLWAKVGQIGRDELEQTVKSGFASAYQANLHDFYPLLSRLSTSQGDCVLGLRLAANADLFVEQYLQQPIERFLPQCQTRAQIAELGNLYSTHRSATLGHFIVVTRAFLDTDIQYLAFTGTLQVRNLMAWCEVPICELSVAQSECVASALDYGSYYAADPKVCVVDLRSAQQVIANNKLFSKLADLYAREAEQLKKGLCV